MLTKNVRENGSSVNVRVWSPPASTPRRAEKPSSLDVITGEAGARAQPRFRLRPQTPRAGPHPGDADRAGRYQPEQARSDRRRFRPRNGTPRKQARPTRTRSPTTGRTTCALGPALSV